MNVSIDLSTLNQISESNSDYGSMLSDSSDYSQSSNFSNDNDDSASDFEMFDLYEEPITEFVFDPDLVYNDDESSNDYQPTITKEESIVEKVEKIRSTYRSAKEKLLKCKTRTGTQIMQIQCLSRVARQIDHHTNKLSKLPNLNQVIANMKSYKVILNAFQHNPSEDTQRYLADLFYNPAKNFFSIYDQCYTTDDYLNNAHKLQANLEQLNEIYPIFKQLKHEMSSEYEFRKEKIKKLRRYILKDLLLVISELQAEETDLSSISSYYSQINNIKTFQRLLNTIDNTNKF